GGINDGVLAASLLHDSVRATGPRRAPKPPGRTHSSARGAEADRGSTFGMTLERAERRPVDDRAHELVDVRRGCVVRERRLVAGVSVPQALRSGLGLLEPTGQLLCPGVL